jgi:hypothetical protein
VPALAQRIAQTDDVAEQASLVVTIERAVADATPYLRGDR